MNNILRCTLIFIFLLCFPCISRAEYVPEQVCFFGQCIKVDIAQTPQEHGRGLQFRESLGKNEGMLFIFQNSSQKSFWMKDTLIALDIIWMDADKNIVSIMSDVPPCKTEECPVYTPQEDALYVLEINAGTALRLGLKKGDLGVFN